MMEVPRQGSRNENRNQIQGFAASALRLLAPAAAVAVAVADLVRRSAATPGGQAYSSPRTNYDAMCVNPRPGTADRSGTRTDENNWLRSWTNELYLWYGEVTDRDPSLYATDTYFDLLKTDAVTPSGQPKDKFHFTYDTDDWIALSQGGTEAGLRRRFAVLAPRPPRRIVVAFTEPDPRRPRSSRAATKSCR